MPTKIRLMRIGAKKRPFYRVVAVDERKKRTGGYIELLGTYNPLTEPKEIILKQDRIDYWLGTGAVPSDGYLRIMKQAPQKPPRKPKREKKEAVPVSEQPAPIESEPTTKEEEPEVSTEEVKEEATVAEEAPAKPEAQNEEPSQSEEQEAKEEAK